MGSRGVASSLMMSAALLTGCTTQLEVRPLGQNSTAPIRGLAYNLPFTQYELTITRTLTKCPSGTNQPGDTLTFKTDVSLVTGAAQPDPDQEYQIDLQGLSSAWKTSDLKVTMKGTVLTQFNATVADQTGTVIQNVASTAEGIASSIVTGGLAPQLAPRTPNAPPPVIILTCSDDSKKALDDLAGTKGAPGLNAKLQVATSKLAADTARLKTLTGASTTIGNTVDPSIQREVFDVAKLIADDTDAIQPIQDQVTSAQSKITTTTTVRWPTSGKLSGTDATFPFQRLLLPGGPDAINGWLKLASTPAQTAAGQDIRDTVDDSFFVLAVQLQRLPGSERVPVSATTDLPSSARDIARKGLRYRTSARAQLILCTTAPILVQDTNSGGDTRVNSGTGTATDISGPKPPNVTWGINGGPPRSPSAAPTAPAPATTIPAPTALTAGTATAAGPPLTESVGNAAACPTSEGTAPYFGATALSIWEGSGPQLGRIQFLPYKNGPFQSNVLSATFNDDGTLATAEYQEPTSRAAAISGTLLQATNAGTSLVKTIVTAPTTKLTNENDYLTAQSNVIKAKAAATTAQETALAQANTDLANALKAEADAKSALTKATAPQ